MTAPDPNRPEDGRRDLNAATAQEEIAQLKHAISGLIPWAATSGRGAAQEALARGCELIGADPYMWSAHPDVLAQRRPDLDRRLATRA